MMLKTFQVKEQFAGIKREPNTHCWTLGNPYWRANGNTPTALQTAKVAKSESKETEDSSLKCEAYIVLLT